MKICLPQLQYLEQVHDMHICLQYLYSIIMQRCCREKWANLWHFANRVFDNILPLPGGKAAKSLWPVNKEKMASLGFCILLSVALCLPRDSCQCLVLWWRSWVGFSTHSVQAVVTSTRYLCFRGLPTLFLVSVSICTNLSKISVEPLHPETAVGNSTAGPQAF